MYIPLPLWKVGVFPDILNSTHIEISSMIFFTKEVATDILIKTYSQRYSAAPRLMDWKYEKNCYGIVNFLLEVQPCWNTSSKRSSILCKIQD